jgi:hypothetical protein
LGALSTTVYESPGAAGVKIGARLQRHGVRLIDVRRVVQSAEPQIVMRAPILVIRVCADVHRGASAEERKCAGRVRVAATAVDRRIGERVRDHAVDDRSV